MLAALAAAEFLGMTLWFSATAAAPALVAEFQLTPARAAWLTMAVQGGFVCGTLLSAFFNLPDVLNPRRLFAAGCVAGALANAAITRVRDPNAAIALRAATGIALAWVYPPGMKIAAGWFERRRGAALGVLVGALTVGSAFPHLLASLAVGVPWRTLLGVASGCALAGAVVVASIVDDGPYLSAAARFDPRAIGRIFSNRHVRLATLGYFGHMWELYAMWTWIAAFAAASFLAVGQSGSSSGSLAAFIAIASGAAGCIVAGFVADRIGKARVAAWAMIVSAGCCLASGFAFDAGRPWMFLLAVVWGIAVVADSALFSALVAEHSASEYVGTALTIQTCLGFLLTTISIELIPHVERIVGWRYAFAILAPGPLFGVISMLRLRALPEAKKIAQGKR